MENLANLNILPQPRQGANPAAPTGSAASGAVQDLFADAGGESVFGALLAKQIALGASADGDPLQPLATADLPDAADLSAQLTQDASMTAGMPAPSGLPVPVLPMSSVAQAASEGFLTGKNQDSPLASPSEIGAAASMGALSSKGGKELPPDEVGVPDIAASDHLPRLIEAVSPSGFTENKGLSPFESLIAEKGLVLPRDFSVVQNGQPAAVQQPAAMSMEKMQPAAQPELSVPQRVGSEGWGQGLGDKVVWIVGNQTRGAEIHLNPPALGPLEVRVSISDGQANLSFMTHSGSVREAIEAATPRLREMMSDTGISMGSVSVNVGSFAQKQDFSGSQAQGGPVDWQHDPAGEAESDAAAVAVSIVRPLHSRGMVDLFA